MHIFNILIGNFDFSYVFKKHKAPGILETLLKKLVIFVPIYLSVYLSIFLCLFHYYTMECAINFSLPILKVFQIHIQPQKNFSHVNIT